MRKLILILIMSAGLSAMAQDAAQPAQDINYAEYLVRNDRRALAYETLGNIVKASPSCARAYYLRALCYMADGNTKPALQDINIALGHEPANVEYLFEKSLIMKALGKVETAGELMEQALLSGPEKNLTDDHRKAQAAEILVLAGNTIDALPIINSIEERKGEFMRVRGMAYAKAGMNDLAIADLSRAIDMNPKATDCYIWRGLARYQNGQRQQARADWEYALQKGHTEARKYLEKYR